MTTVTNKQEAMEFFLSNSSGSCTCDNGKSQKEVNCYPDAVDFFNDEETNEDADT